MKRIFFIILILMSSNIYGDITKGELQLWNSRFLSLIISDNKNQEQEIRRTLNSVIKYKNSGYRLLDRFGLFLYEASNNNLKVQKINFFSNKEKIIFNIFLRDLRDNNLYCLYLEYERGDNNIKIKDTLFLLSVTESEGAVSLKNFFGAE